ncbi:MFS transporter [Myxococcota bacterium]|nr:MFS transporter [Myxococcota bacterium]
MSTEDPRPSLFNAAYVRVLLMQGCFGAAMATFVLLPKYLLTELDASVGEIGGVMAAFSLANVMAIPLVGHGVDRVGRREIVLLGLACMLVSTLGFGWIDGMGPSLYFLRGLQGVSFACVYVSASTLIADYAPATRLSQGLALLGATMHATNAIVPWVVERTSEQTDWQTAFGAAALAVVAAMVIALKIPGGPTRRSDPSTVASLGTIARRTAFQRGLFVMLMVGTVVAAMTTFVQPLAIERGVQRVATFFLAFSGTAMAVRVLLGGWMDRTNRFRVCVFATGSYGLLLLATLGVTESTLPVLGSLLGFVHGLFFPSFTAMMLQKVDASERGRIMALLSGSFNVGLGVSTFALGLLAGAAGYAASFGVAAASAAAACLMLLSRPGPTRWSAAQRD